MRLLLTFIIFILGVFYTFGDDNCCEQCCEYLGNCCNKGKEEVKNENNVGENKEEKGEEEKEVKNENNVGENKGEKGEENEVQEEAKNLVNKNWLDNKKNNGGLVLKIFNKDENENVNEYKSGNITINLKKENDKTEITNLEDVGENLKTNTKKWALFKIIYKEKKEEGEEGKTVYLYCSNIETFYLYRIFSNCEQHISISVIACDTSGVTNMSGMFSGCSSLTKIDLSNFNTEKVIHMSHMFSGCSSLTKIDLSNFNTEKVTDMSNMFSNCSFLTELNLSKFDTKNVKKMSFMFFECSSLRELDLSNFNTENITNRLLMFDKCSSLHTVTFNNNLNEGIKQQLENLGFTEKIKEKGNVITLGKKP